MRRLIIADPGLSGPAGHHLSYSAAVAGAAAGRGLAAVVLAARGFSGGIDGAQCRAVLGAAYQSAGGGGAARRFAFGLAARLPGPLAGMVAPPLRALRRALRPVALDPLGAELARELAALGAGEGDALLLHSVSGANLHGLTAAALPAVTLLVVLRRMPAEMAADDPAPEPLPALLRRLSRHFGPRLRLFADTQALATQFSALCGVEVRAVPLPLRVPPVLQRPSARPPYNSMACFWRRADDMVFLGTPSGPRLPEPGRRHGRLGGCGDAGVSILGAHRCTDVPSPGQEPDNHQLRCPGTAGDQPSAAAQAGCAA